MAVHLNGDSALNSADKRENVTCAAHFHQSVETHASLKGNFVHRAMEMMVDPGPGHSIFLTNLNI
jgi:hypothetical protein